MLFISIETFKDIVARFLASDNAKYLKEFVEGQYDIPFTKYGICGLPRVERRGKDQSLTAPTLLFYDLPGSRNANVPAFVASMVGIDTAITSREPMPISGVVSMYIPESGESSALIEKLLSKYYSARHLPLFGVPGCGKT